MNPLASNPLRSRADFARAAVQLWSPLKPHFSAGCARVTLSQTGTHFGPVASALEGFSRPLFGLAPLAAGGGDFADWDMFRTGYANGTDPDHPEYWGTPRANDQRLVEAAAISFGLLFAKEQLWDAQTPAAQANIAAWLKACLACQVPDNNWQFFHVLDSLALEHVGVDHDRTVREDCLQALESYYLDDGWYADGAVRRFDHYTPFAMHLYGLLYSKLAHGDDARRQRFRDRAATFAQEYQHWFDANGACIAYGRSMTYRFAMNAFWGALGFADVEALPWGQIRGLWERNMQWWGQRDVYDRDGVLSVGYLYPNLLVAENYASPCSPYWSMKSFLPLALAEDHPFWTAPPVEKQQATHQYAQPITGVIGYGNSDDRIMLTGCCEMRRSHKGGAEKYGKFAYSSAFGFSVDHDSDAFFANPFDNMLAFSRDGRSFTVRRDIDEAVIGDDWVFSQWSPEPGITVDTWLIARAPWHLRYHRITSKHRCLVTEGGFAIKREDDDPEHETAKNGIAKVQSEGQFSHVINGPTAPRQGVVRRAMPNSSLMYPRSFVPHLTGKIEVGETWLSAAVCAGINADKTEESALSIPDFPDVDTLLALRKSGRPVSGMTLREPDPLHMNRVLLEQIGFEALQPNEVSDEV
ncbi:DUF2264 domain-containing protein [Litoreibacter albidus]|uniref:DUF2264 domain-containing protein n=1 Tax=Litoreibacter albidus TaxID=670155 RepID=A0A1H3CIR4_9RHOB|nr:DUF2264 domain-containing protein [Litoreibacter albidus]SDX54033.1 hypothetical protein SAMN04488001_3449 [Litoreibacter albidus]